MQPQSDHVQVLSNFIALYSGLFQSDGDAL
jgi:hypothetical protein